MEDEADKVALAVVDAMDDEGTGTGIGIGIGVACDGVAVEAGSSLGVFEGGEGVEVLELVSRLATGSGSGSGSDGDAASLTGSGVDGVAFASSLLGEGVSFDALVEAGLACAFAFVSSLEGDGFSIS